MYCLYLDTSDSHQIPWNLDNYVNANTFQGSNNDINRRNHNDHGINNRNIDPNQNRGSKHNINCHNNNGSNGDR